MEYKEIEQKLWSELLNRLQMEKNASPTEEVTFLLDKGSFEGVRLYDFQDKALAKLLKLGALVSMRAYRRQTPLMRALEEANQHVMSPSQPDGYELRFSEDKFKSVLTRLRHSLAKGDIYEEPVLELSLDKLKLIANDLETGEKYVIYKMKLDSQMQDVLEFVFNRQRFDINDEDLSQARIQTRGGLNNLVNAMKLPSVVKNAFFKATKKRLIVYSVIFKSDLVKIDIDIECLRKELIESGKV